MPLPNLIGLTLTQAQSACEGREVTVVETAPPFTPRHYTPVWGQWRVLRAREVEVRNGAAAIELLVARELLREEKRDPNEVRASGQDSKPANS